MRETFLLPVTIINDKGDEKPAFIHTHHIQAILPGEKSTMILTGTGVTYTVKETFETITRLSKGVGTMVVLK